MQTKPGTALGPRLLALPLCLIVLALSSACGGGQPQAESTWETHTTAEEEGGEEAAPEDDTASP